MPPLGYRRHPALPQTSPPMHQDQTGLGNLSAIRQTGCRNTTIQWHNPRISPCSIDGDGCGHTSLSLAPRPQLDQRSLGLGAESGCPRHPTRVGRFTDMQPTSHSHPRAHCASSRGGAGLRAAVGSRRSGGCAWGWTEMTWADVTRHEMVMEGRGGEGKERMGEVRKWV